MREEKQIQKKDKRRDYLAMNRKGMLNRGNAEAKKRPITLSKGVDKWQSEENPNR